MIAHVRTPKMVLSVGVLVLSTQATFVLKLFLASVSANFET